MSLDKEKNKLYDPGSLLLIVGERISYTEPICRQGPDFAKLNSSVTKDPYSVWFRSLQPRSIDVGEIVFLVKLIRADTSYLLVVFYNNELLVSCFLYTPQMINDIFRLVSSIEQCVG